MKKASDQLRTDMTDATAQTPEDPVDNGKKPGKMPLVIGLVLAVAGGAGGYFTVQTGLLPFGSGVSETPEHSTPASHDPEHTADRDGNEQGANQAAQPIALPDIAYVSLDPITISLSTDNGLMHLRFRAELEVNKAHAHDVELIRPRVVDVLNGYLRALEMQDLQNTQALARLRAQMLRRIQIVAGHGRVRDLLIMDFILN